LLVELLHTGLVEFVVKEFVRSDGHEFSEHINYMVYTLVEFLVGLQFEGLLGVVGHYPGGGHEFSFGIVDKATLAERYTDGNER
jgi:hypothetical protein